MSVIVDEARPESQVAEPQPPVEPTPAPAKAVEPEVGRIRKPLRAFRTLMFGGVGLLTCLATLAMIPILQFMTLGWLLEAEGRLGRGERWRDALPGLRKAAQIGSGVIGFLILLAPIAFLNSFYVDAKLIDPTSPQTQGLGVVLLGMIVVAGTHGTLALAAGRGRLIHLFRPFHNVAVLWRGWREGRRPRDGAQALWAFLTECRLPHYLALGTKGFAAGVIWLAIPTLLLVAGSKVNPVFALLGAVALTLVLPYALLAQARLAAEDDFGAAFRWRELRARAKRAPLSLSVALIVSLGLALPLYLWKIELLPRDALWLPALFFVVLLLPGRLLMGWAHHRGGGEGKAHWSLRLVGGGVAFSAAGAYVFFSFFSQYFSWGGAASLFAQHSVLLPVAFY